MRYRLMPYIYSLAAGVHFGDYTIMRPLVMDFGHDSHVNNIGYQYMFGPSFMVCPIYTYKARHTLTIGKRQGTFPGMLQSRSFNIVFVNATNARGYNPDARGKKVTYKGQEIKVKL